MIIKRVLAGTNREVTLELNEVEATHMMYLERKGFGVQMPMDMDVLMDMTNLANHFERRSDDGK